MVFPFLRPPTWGVLHCESGKLVTIEKLPFTIGSAEDADLRLEGHGVGGRNCTFSKGANGSLVLTPGDPYEGAVIVNGKQVGETLRLEREQDYSLVVGPHPLAIRASRKLDAWRAKIDAKNWIISHGPSNTTLGPAPLPGLLVRALEQRLDPDQTVCYPFGISNGFWLRDLRAVLSAPGALFSTDGAAPKPLATIARRTDDPSTRIATDQGELTCPVCWLKFDIGDVMHIAMHDSLRGDPILGEDASPRFHATKFNDRGQALDATGIPCTDVACPHCRTRLPPGFLDSPHYIFSLVGNASAGKSYYLSILAKVLPTSLFRNLDLVWQDADPAGNAPLNAMKNRIFGAADAEEAALEKTVLGGAMYLQAPRHGKSVQMPRPFVYNVAPKDHRETNLSIIFYDNAGEHFRPDIKIEDSPGALHVASASAIFFLFDPTRNYEFRQRLVGHEDPQLTMSMNDLQDVMLSEMKTRIMRLQNLSVGERIHVPLAVMVGKFDAWYHLLGDEPVYKCMDSKRDGLKLDSIEHNSKLTRDLLLDVCPTIVANAEALSDNVCYFPVSAFGHTPVVTSLGTLSPDPLRLSPILLEAPTLWVLQQIAPEFVPIAKPFLADRQAASA